jgi:hypothetical protein
MTSDHDAMTAAFTQLRRLEIGSERVKTWPRHWQRAAELEGLIRICDGTVRVVEPELVTEPTETTATMAHTLVLIDDKWR